MPMNVILTEDVPHLGIAGQVVKVKPGYARNYLMPRGMALLATDGRVKELEHKKRVIEERQRKEVAGHEDVARRLNRVKLEFAVLAGETGKLFGSVTSADIHGELKSRGFELDRRKIDLGDPIKELGSYDVRIRLHREVHAEIKVVVQPAEGSGAAADQAAAAEEAARLAQEEAENME
jgi:large subunit ribosomal protein L9